MTGLRLYRLLSLAHGEPSGKVFEEKRSEDRFTASASIAALIHRCANRIEICPHSCGGCFDSFLEHVRWPPEFEARMRCE